MKRIKKNCLFGCILFLLFFTSGCGQNTRPVVTGQYYHPSDTAAEETEEAEKEDKETKDVSIGTDLYLIVSNDTAHEQLNLKQLASGRQYMYLYSLSTRFLDKYGDTASAAEFEAGRVIHIGKKDSDDRLTEAKLADEVWEYSDITKYSVDAERGIFKIADSKYSYDPDLFVESDGNQIRLSALNEKDEIRVVGIGTKILSVSVTTGHGNLELKNTSLFEGSFIQIGKKIFAQITRNMTLEIPEGTYTVTVANQGYGGSKEVTIARGETYTLDLDELKGEGPKTGKILFYIDAVDAILEIDGESVDYSKPVELTYGVHTVHAEAEGYDDYEKKLFVNSAAADIDISMTGSNSVKTGEEAEDADTESTETEETTGESSRTENGESEQSDKKDADAAKTEESKTDKSDVTTDYLSTLTDLITSLKS